VSDDAITLIEGHVIDVLREMPAKSISCVITSPPYWGLRDYGLPDSDWADGWSGCLGLEPTPDLFLVHLVEVFEEVKRVLRDDGCVFCNMGDCYKDKQRLMMPARCALALQAAGWWLRSEIVWAKGLSFCPTYSGSVMPSSVRDRPTDAHEMMYLLTKRPRYFYDQEAVREEAADDSPRDRATRMGAKRCATGNHGSGAPVILSAPGRNIRSVFCINPQAYKAAHFATFPEKLVEPCILAGTSERGCCADCGAPWVREVEKSGGTTGKAWHDHNADDEVGQRAEAATTDGTYQRTTTGWKPTCDHDAEVVPCVVLDPFAGSGTVGAVCVKHGRNFIGVDLSGEYLDLAEDRIGLAEAAEGWLLALSYDGKKWAVWNDAGLTQKEVRRRMALEDIKGKTAKDILDAVRGI